MRTFKEKQCKFCGSMFVPTGSSHKFCTKEHQYQWMQQEGIHKHYRDTFNAKQGKLVGIGSGGTTGTGRFASELAGSQTTRNIAGIRTNLSNVLLSIDNKVDEVREVTNVALRDIDDRADEGKRIAKRQLDATLNQIRSSKAELQSRKVELAQQAMQWYQGEIAKVNASNAQFKQELQLESVRAENQLALARQKAELERGKISGTSGKYDVNSQQIIGGNRTSPINQGAQAIQVPGVEEEDEFIDKV